MINRSERESDSHSNRNSEVLTLAFKTYVKIPGTERDPCPARPRRPPPIPIRLSRPRWFCGREASGRAVIFGPPCCQRRTHHSRGIPGSLRRRSRRCAATVGLRQQLWIGADACDPGGRTSPSPARWRLYAAFQVEFAQYEHPGGSYRGRTGAISVPKDWAASFRRARSGQSPAS